MRYIYCPVCGTKMVEKEVENEGLVPYCPSCEQYRFPVFSVAVSMIVTNESDGKILLIKQYGKDSYILVAGYVNRTESIEHAAVREVQEETGMSVSSIHFNRSKFFEPSDTLMCNFTVSVHDDRELNTNEEIDSYAWFTPEEALREIKPNSLAKEFLKAYLNDTSQGSDEHGKRAWINPAYRGR